MSEDELLSAVISSKPVKKREKNFDDKKPKITFSKPRIEKIRKELMNQAINFLNQK